MLNAKNNYPVQGAGLGLRRALMDRLIANPPDDVDFMEVAPENWVHVGGKLGHKFRFFTERYPVLLHGLSLSIGGPSPLNDDLLHDIRGFMADHDIDFYSEHLSYCGDNGMLYDLMPMPFTEEAVKYVAKRIRHAQDILGFRIAVENVSYYAPADTSMTEAEFINAVLEEADCDLLLDINNIVVNSINHQYDATEFMLDMPADRIKYFHQAGHYVEAEDLRIDTHGASVCEQSWQLLADAYAHFGPVPTLLERDFNFPPIEDLLDEVRQIRSMQRTAGKADLAETAHG